MHESDNPAHGSERISVCHLISGDLWAGAEVQVVGLLKALARRSGLQLSAVVLNPGRLVDELGTAGIEVKVIPESRTDFFGVAAEAREFLLRVRPHILHSHRYKENTLAAWLARSGLVPLRVRTQHGFPEPFVGLRGFRHGLVQAFDRLTARHATDCVIAVTEELRTRLVQNLPADRVVTIHNGIEVNQFQPRFSRERARERLGLPVGCWTLGTAGRLEPVKRLDLFLQAARHLSQKVPQARFLIAGEGSAMGDLREMSQTLGLQDRVQFLGHRDDMPDVLQCMDILVLSSDHEGLPMILLEALCLRVNVVARSVGGIPEAMTDGVHGVLVDSADPVVLAEKCLQLRADPIRRKRMAQE
ncbi:MAG: glycosyltransferase, partial [Terriglobales bacterium]